MISRLLNIVLVAAILSAAWQGSRRYVALRIALAQPDAAGFERGLAWDPRNPDLHFMLARLYRDVPALRDPDAARTHAERAAELSPYSWRAQSQLAQLYEVSGLDAQAERAYLKTVELNPLGAADHWRLANFHLRSGDVARAYPPLRVALASDPTLLGPGWTLLSKLDADLTQIDRVWPEDRHARLFLLQSLVRDHRRVLDPALPGFLGSTWDRLHETADALTPAEASFYLDYLLATGRQGDARRRWIEVAAASGLDDEAFETNRNLVWNGRFELPLTDTGFDWRIARSAAFTASPAPQEGALETTALRIEFRGTENLELTGVWQRIGVLPDARYELFYQARSLELTTDEGVFLEIWAPTQRRRLLATPKTRGTTPWSPALLSFMTPPETTVIELRVRRNRSLQIDNRLAGTFWLDNVSLTPTPP